MSNAIEIEAKALVRKDDYEKLLSMFPGNVTYTQTNYYVDNDEGLLRKEGIGLRIREKDGRYEMTLKTPLSQGFLEKSCVWDKALFDSFSKGESCFPEGDIKRFLTMLDIDVSKLKIRTALSTTRTDVHYLEGKLSIDENHYSDMVDYEVELEYSNEAAAENLLKSLLESHDIPFRLSKKTKVTRALDAYEASLKK